MFLELSNVQMFDFIAILKNNLMFKYDGFCVEMDSIVIMLWKKLTGTNLFLLLMVVDYSFITYFIQLHLR